MNVFQGASWIKKCCILYYLTLFKGQIILMFKILAEIFADILLSRLHRFLSHFSIKS